MYRSVGEGDGKGKGQEISGSCVRVVMVGGDIYGEMGQVDVKLVVRLMLLMEMLVVINLREWDKVDVSELVARL